MGWAYVRSFKTVSVAELGTDVLARRERIFLEKGPVYRL